MRIKVVSPNAQRAAHIADIVRGSAPGLDVLTAAAASSLPQAVNGSRPALLVVDGVDANGLDQIAAFTQDRPDVETIIVASEQTPAFLLKAMQAGVREVLPQPLADDSLRAAVLRVARKQQRPVDTPAEPGQVLAFMACKGGSGATFLAANLAHALSQRDGRTVALIDLDLQFGDALLMISDHPAGSDVADLSAQIHRLDAQLLRAAMVQASGTLSVLPGPGDLTHALEVQPEHIEAIVKQARQMFDFVVLDVGRAINAVSLRALDMADHVFPVLQMNVPNVRDAKRLRQLFTSLGYAAEKIHWVVNRFQKNDSISLDALEQALATKAITTVPNHYAGVSASVNQGVPIDKMSKSHPVSRALLGLAQQVSPSGAKGRKEGWLNTIFGMA
jgi:pilus assembly protein CpaE